MRRGLELASPPKLQLNFLLNSRRPPLLPYLSMAIEGHMLDAWALRVRMCSGSACDRGGGSVGGHGGEDQVRER